MWCSLACSANLFASSALFLEKWTNIFYPNNRCIAVFLSLLFLAMLDSHKIKSGHARLFSFLIFKFVMHKMWLEATDCTWSLQSFSLFFCGKSSWQRRADLQSFLAFFFCQGKFSETNDVSWTPELEQALNFDKDSAWREDGGAFSCVKMTVCFVCVKMVVCFCLRKDDGLFSFV